MTSSPLWLPPMVCVDGIWENVLIRLYAIFEVDFKQGRPSLKGRPIWWDRRILPGDRYEEVFWHLITEDDKETGNRVPDLERARRLPWCAPTIRNHEDSVVTVWDYEERAGRVRTYLWLEAHDYVVIIEKARRGRNEEAKEVAILVTAFYVKYEWKKQQLRRKYRQRCL